MSVYPKEYTKNTFIKFLRKNNVSDDIILKFNELPELLAHKNSVYKLNVEVTWYDIGNTHYNFELNYYSIDKMEYLFGLKVFSNVEKSINYLYSELINAKFIEK